MTNMRNGADLSMLFWLYWEGSAGWPGSRGCRKDVSPSWVKFADCLSGERLFATSLSRTVIQAVRINTITEKSIIRADLPPSMKKGSHHGEQWGQRQIEISSIQRGVMTVHYDVMTVQYKVMTGSHRPKGFAPPPIVLLLKPILCHFVLGALQ